MADGLCVALPGYEVQRTSTDTDIAREALCDAYAVDCRIRSAIDSFDLLHEWTNGLGHEVSGAVRRNCTSIQNAIIFMQTSTDISFN
eukprot:9488060-Pyramimonas_sp.AAC.1